MDDRDRIKIMRYVEKGDISVIVELIRDRTLNVKGYDDDNSTVLHMAIKEHQLDFASFLLSSGADEKEVNDHGESAFHLAARLGHKDIAEMLVLKKGIDQVNRHCESDTRETALHLAVENDHLDLIKFLLDDLAADTKAGANRCGCDSVTPVHMAVHLPNLRSLICLAEWEGGKLLRLEDTEGNTPLHLAVKLPQVSALRALVVKCGVDVDEVFASRNGWAVLHEAAALNLQDMADILVNELGGDVDAVTKTGRLTPLHVAVQAGQRDMVKHLLKLQASVGAQDELGDTPLHWAARLGSVNIIRILFDKGKADVEVRNNSGRTPLGVVCGELGDRQSAEVLIKHCGAETYVKSNADDYDGATPFHLACIKQHYKLAKTLISLTKSDCLSYENAKGENAIYQLTRRSDASVVQFLIKAGASTSIVCSGSGRAPLHVAAIRDDAEVAKVLIEGGADPKMPSSGKKDKTFTPIMMAAERNSRAVFEYLLECEIKSVAVKGEEDVKTRVISSILQQVLLLGDNPKVIRFLSEQMGDSNIGDACGFLNRTPLHTAVYGKCIGAVKEFIRSGCKVNPKSSARDCSRIPLHFAAMLGADDIIDVLLAAGAKLNEKDANGNRVLHMAALAGHLNTVKKLIDLGVDVGKRGAGKKTALHGACVWIGESYGCYDTTDGKQFLDLGNETDEDGKDRKQDFGLLSEIMIRDPKPGSSSVEGRRVVPFSDNSYWNKLEIAKLLIEESAALGSVKDRNSDRAIHLAAAGGHVDMVRFFVNWTPSAFLEARGSLGLTPLHYAVSHFQSNTIMYLIKDAKACPNTRTAGEDGERTALHRLLGYGALTKKILATIRLLIEGGSNLESCDGRGDRPMHVAVEASDRDSNFFDAISVLLEAGATLEARSKTFPFHTPLERAIASKTDNTRPLTFLLQLGAKLHDYGRAEAIAKNAENKNILEYLERFKPPPLVIDEY